MKKVLCFVMLFLSSPVMAELFPSLIGGRPARKGEYPEIIYIRSGNNSRCSASVVGKYVILTAAHCVKDEGEIGPVPSPALEEKDIEFVVDQTVYKAKCNQAPLYRDKKEDHDMALCKTDKPMTVKPASISKTGPEIGDLAILTGYGCIKGPGGTGGNDGILRVGKAEVTRLPAGSNHWFYTDSESALCFGDSGGPALLDTREHLIIGVNSRGNIQNLSLLTAVYTPASQKFLKDFAREKKVDICGVTKGC